MKQARLSIYKSYTILLFTLFFGLFQNSYSQVTSPKDTLFFDGHWKSTTKGDHEFYRPIPLKTVGNLSLIQDYYKNGNKQMQGYVYTDSLDVLVGDVYWYDKNGDDSSYAQYFNPTDLSLTYYHDNGRVWKTVMYQNGVKHGTFKIFTPQDVEITTRKFENGFTANDTIGKFTANYYRGTHPNKVKRKASTNTEVLYWKNGTIAKVTTSQEGTMLNERSYTSKGQLIQQFYENDFIEDELLYNRHYTLRTNNGFAVALDTIPYNNQEGKVLYLDDINHVTANASYGNVTFYKKEGEDAYKEVEYEFLYDEDIPRQVLKIKGESEDYKTQEALKKRATIGLDVNTIKTQSIEDFLKTLSKTEWVTPKKNIRYGDTISSKRVVTQFNSELFLDANLEFETAYNGGFGSYYKANDDDVKKWRLEAAQFYTLTIVVLNKNKPIALLTREGDLEYYIIPTTEGFVVNFNESNTVTQEKPSLLEQFGEAILLYSNTANFYGIQVKDGKQYLTTMFNEIAIDKAYDSIQRNRGVIMGRNPEGIDLYNLKLDPLLTNVRQAYYDRGNIQVLHNNKVTYITAFGKETERRHIQYSFCGTVSSTDFEILHSDDKMPVNAIKITSGYFGDDFRNPRILKLTNLTTEYDVKFLNGTDKDGYNGNSSFVDGYINRTHMLLVRKDTKVGLYSYDAEVTYHYKPEKNTTETILPPEIAISKYASTQAKVLLPITYDSIEEKGALIIVKKDKKFGIYPLENGLKYSSLGEIKGNFIPYEIDTGERGWIDINTHKEYPNVQ